MRSSKNLFLIFSIIVLPVKYAIKFDFVYDGGRGAGGTGTIYVEIKKTGEGNIAKTNYNTFGIDESADVGEDMNICS